MAHSVRGSVADPTPAFLLLLLSWTLVLSSSHRGGLILLKENTLFGFTDKVAMAIHRIREYEAIALKHNPAGYWVAFSGGKDSMVLLDLVRRAGVKYEAHFSLTTVDPPELLAFVREHYPEVHRRRPKLGMFGLIAKKGIPPVRMMRYCCSALKESGGNGFMVLTGVRWAESVRRSKRKMAEACYKKATWFLHPIIDWTDTDVWDYIRGRGLPYCSLYDEGFHRIGCVGCPCATLRQRKKDFRRWPKFEALYRRACDKAAKKPMSRWKSGEDMFNWWMSDCGKTDDESQPTLFG